MEPVSIESAPKRRRRLAEDIDRTFTCPYERCRKVYGTLGSLQQHHRLKHSPNDPSKPIVIDESS